MSGSEELNCSNGNGSIISVNEESKRQNKLICRLLTTQVQITMVYKRLKGLQQVRIFNFSARGVDVVQQRRFTHIPHVCLSQLHPPYTANPRTFKHNVM